MVAQADNLSKAETVRLAAFSARVAIGAGRILKEGFSKGKKIRFKGRIDPVTQFDLKSEKYIVGRIQKSFPTHDILSEEGASTDSNSDFRWIIDPLDGTVNFSHGFPLYCVSIALEYKGKIIVGAVHDPERKETFTAAEKQGAYLNGRRIRVSTESKLQRSLLATGFAYDVATARTNNLGLFARMIKKAQAVRRPGSAAIDLCWLACGRLDGFWEYSLYPWDTAAAALIVEQAGGKVTRLNGQKFGIFDNNILASNARLYRTLKRALTSR